MPTQPKPVTTSTTIRLDPQTHELLRVEAAKRNTTQSDVITEALHLIASVGTKRKPRKQPA